MVLTNQQILIDKDAELIARCNLDCRAHAGIPLYERIARIQNRSNRTSYGFLPWAAVIASGRMSRCTLRRCGQDGTQESRTVKLAAVVRVLILKSRIPRAINGLLLRQSQGTAIRQDDSIELYADALIAKTTSTAGMT